ncbi:MAG: hypothetical protein LBB67_00310 [Oscillospiraceae bacterium]|nr:hypothetical protein [Oscillospiraceae bacterium]
MKRIFSVLCVLALLIGTCAFSAQAAEQTECACADIPFIRLHGIGETLYLNEGTPDEKEVGVANTEALQDAIIPLALSIVKAAAARSWSEGAKAIEILATALFGRLQVDTDGKSVQPITRTASVNPDQNHKENPIYDFDYDWRLDPMDSAKKLAAHIKEVQRVTGHKKVILCPQSEGGLIVTAYLAQEGSDAIDHIIPVMAAHGGLSMVGELATKKIDISGRAAARYLRSYLGEEGDMGIVSSLIGVLDEAKLLDAVTEAVGILIQNTGEQLYRDVFVPLLFQWPALWGFIPNEYYDEAKAKLLDDPKYDNFKKIIDEYHNKAGAIAGDLYRQAAQNGVKVSVIAGWNFSGMPFSGKADTMTDGLIDTSLESFGAICAPYGEVFSADYIQKIADGYNHISPDFCLDASACLFPESTWFIKNQIHFSFDSSSDFVRFLRYSQKQPTVRTNSQFPQFMTRLSDGTFVPATAEQTIAKEYTLFSAAWELIERIANAAVVNFF